MTAAGVVTELATEAAFVFTFSRHRFDMQITNFNNAATNVKVYLDGNLLINWTGNTVGLGFTDLDVVRMVHSKMGTAVSEIIMADSDTRPLLGVGVLYPNGAGVVNTFDTGAYTDIDETVLDDADMITSGSNGQIFEAALSNAPAGNYTVRAGKVTVRSAKGASGPGTLKIGIDSGGVDNVVDKAQDVALDSYERMMLVNPVTSGLFTIAELNALQVCLESAA